MNGKKDDLAKRIYQGDKTAEKELFVHYQEKISTLIRNRLGKNHPDWEDILSETQMAILLILRDGMFDPEKGNLDAYIYGIVANQIKHYYNRSAKKEETFIEDIPLKYFVNPIDKEQDPLKETLEILNRDVISKLKPKYKEVLYLRYFQGYSIQDISNRLGIESKRVSERINYAIKLINKKVKK